MRETEHNELSLWNPLDHMRLLWWTLVDPQQLKSYQSQFGEASVKRTGKWLVSTLICLPFLLLFSAVGFEVIPFVPTPESGTGLTAFDYLWVSGVLLITWHLTGAFGDIGNDWADLVVVTLMVLAVAILSGGMSVVLSRAAAGVLTAIVVVMMTGVFTLTEVLAEERASMLALGMGTLLTGILAVGVMEELGVEATGGAIEVLATLLLVALWLGVARVLGNVIKESVKTGRASWLTQGTFWLLVATDLFLVWYSYLGGWQLLA